MYFRNKIILFSLTFIFIISINSFSQITDRERVDMLQMTFDNITLSAQIERFTKNISLIIMGGTYSYFGISYIIDYGITADQVFAMGTSAFQISAGFYGIIVQSKAETMAYKYRKMPENTEEEIHIKAQKGETLLKDIADSAWSNRMIMGGIMAGLGAGEFIFYLLTDDSTLMVYSIINLSYGLINLLLFTNVELNYWIYKEWANAYRAGQNTEKTYYRFTITPLGVGINASFRVSY